jgi:hypothetical protein
MIVYDIASSPDFGEGSELEDIITFALNKGILIYDSSKNGDKPYLLDDISKSIKIVDVKGLDVKQFINDNK